MSGQHTWCDTLQTSCWSVDPEGLWGAIFDRAIPPFAEENLRPAIEGILSRSNLSVREDRFACHPGGAKVIDALESALISIVAHSTMNAMFFRNSETCPLRQPCSFSIGLLRPLPPPRILLTAMGPGFTVSCVSPVTTA